MIINLENPKSSRKKVLRPINKFGTFVEYKFYK